MDEIQETCQCNRYYLFENYVNEALLPVNIAHLMSTQSVKLIENAAQYIFVELIETLIQSTKCEYLPFLASSRHTKKLNVVFILTTTKQKESYHIYKYGLRWCELYHFVLTQVCCII